MQFSAYVFFFGGGIPEDIESYGGPLLIGFSL